MSTVSVAARIKPNVISINKRSCTTCCNKISRWTEVACTAWSGNREAESQMVHLPTLHLCNTDPLQRKDFFFKATNTKTLKKALKHRCSGQPDFYPNGVSDFKPEQTEGVEKQQ